jgi:3-hydroxyisobutyrate dehydrogenase-like beta-hydroxyacid dehydrogenase
VVIDTSTSDPGTSRRLAERLAAGHGLLDALVSGGPSGAAEGSLTMMIGGSEADLALATPVIEALSARARALRRGQHCQAGEHHAGRGPSHHPGVAFSYVG